MPQAMPPQGEVLLLEALHPEDEGANNSKSTAPEQPTPSPTSTSKMKRHSRLSTTKQASAAVVGLVGYQGEDVEGLDEEPQVAEGSLESLVVGATILVAAVQEVDSLPVDVGGGIGTK